MLYYSRFWDIYVDDTNPEATMMAQSSIFTLSTKCSKPFTKIMRLDMRNLWIPSMLGMDTRVLVMWQYNSFTENIRYTWAKLALATISRTGEASTRHLDMSKQRITQQLKTDAHTYKESDVELGKKIQQKWDESYNEALVELFHFKK